MIRSSIMKFFTTPAVKLKFGSSPQMTSRPRFLKGGSQFLSEKSVNFLSNLSQLFGDGSIVFIGIIIICGVPKGVSQFIPIVGVVLLERYRTIFIAENLQGVALTDIAGAADFLRNDHSAQVIIPVAFIVFSPFLPLKTVFMLGSKDTYF